jgi:hypothetical protein
MGAKVGLKLILLSIKTTFGARGRTAHEVSLALKNLNAIMRQLLAEGLPHRLDDLLGSGVDAGLSPVARDAMRNSEMNGDGMNGNVENNGQTSEAKFSLVLKAD